MLALDDDGLWCAPGRFHVDPWGAVPLAVITHAHADHARPGSGRYLCAREGAKVLERRLALADPSRAPVIEALDYGEERRIGDALVSLHPAGHVLGSAQVRVRAGGETWLVTGDFKRAPDPTCAPFEPVRADVLITEATFALPIYRWAPTEDVVREVIAYWDEAVGENVNALIFCYALGKAQRLVAELARLAPDRTVHVHGAIAAMNEVYRASGVDVPETIAATELPRGSVKGALILAPPSARGTPWMRRFGAAREALASGWMRVRGDRRRRTLDRGFALSDHADWPALLDTVRESGASRVLVTHGRSDALARHLVEQGLDARVLRTRWEGETNEGDEPAAER